MNTISSNCTLILYEEASFTFAAVVTGAPQTDSTAVIVGGVTAVIIVLIVTVSVTIIVVVALLRNRTGQPARTTAQYVDICANTLYQCYYHQSVLLCAGSP